MVKYDEYVEYKPICTLTDEECHGHNCTYCGVAEEWNTDHENEEIKSICEFTKIHCGLALNSYNTVLRGSSISEFDRYLTEESDKVCIEKYSKVGYIEKQMIEKRWPHLCIVMTEEKQHIPPKYYLYGGVHKSLFAVFSDVVYMAAPKIPPGER